MIAFLKFIGVIMLLESIVFLAIIAMWYWNNEKEEKKLKEGDKR